MPGKPTPTLARGSRPGLRHPALRARGFLLGALAALSFCLGLPLVAEETVESEPYATARAYLQAVYTESDFEAMATFLTEESVWEDPTMAYFGDEKVIEGADAIVEFYRWANLGGETRTTVEVKNHFVTGERVMMDVLYTTTSDGVLVGYPGVQLHGTSRGFTILQIRDGKVLHHLDHIDYPGLMRQVEEQAKAQGALLAQPVKHAEFYDAKVAYHDMGEGPTVLAFVHGWAGTSAVWQAQSIPLRDKVRALYIDLPGHGQSEPSNFGYTADASALAIRAVLDHAGVDRAILVGHSNGVPLIRHFYRRFPDRVQALVAVDGAFKRLVSAPRMASALDALRSDGYRDVIPHMVPPMANARIRDEIQTMMLSIPQDVLTQTLAAMTPDALWTPDPIQVPTLVVLAKSPFWSDEYAGFVRELIPGVDYRTLDGVSHYLMWESPDVFNPILLGFVDQLNP